MRQARLMADRESYGSFSFDVAKKESQFANGRLRLSHTDLQRSPYQRQWRWP
jgi:hypothetical protein